MRFNGLLLKDFDPLSVDITEIQNIVDEVKKINTSDMQLLEELMIKCVNAMDICTDLICNATVYSCYCESKLKKAKADAIEERLTKKTQTTVIKDIIYNNKEIIKWTELYSVSMSFIEWLKEKKDVLSKTFHMMKDIYNKNTNINIINRNVD